MLSSLSICMIGVLVVLVPVDILLACLVGLVLPEHFVQDNWFYTGSVVGLSKNEAMILCNCYPEAREPLEVTLPAVTTTTKPEPHERKEAESKLILPPVNEARNTRRDVISTDDSHDRETTEEIAPTATDEPHAPSEASESISAKKMMISGGNSTYESSPTQIDGPSVANSSELPIEATEK